MSYRWIIEGPGVSLPSLFVVWADREVDAIDIARKHLREILPTNHKIQSDDMSKSFKCRVMTPDTCGCKVMTIWDGDC